MNKLKSLEVKSFRGIYNETINLNGKSLILYGENGTGKSSFINALEYLFTSEIAFFKNEDVILKDVIVNYNSKPDDLLVKATFDNNLTIEHTIANKPTYDKELQSLYDELSTGSFLLNRQKLLKFINATKSNRYNAISDLFGFGELDTIENKLKTINKSINDDIKGLKNKSSSKIVDSAKLLGIDYDLVLKNVKKFNRNVAKDYEFKDEISNTLSNCSNDLNDKIKAIGGRLAYDVDGIEVIYDMVLSKLNFLLSKKDYPLVDRDTDFEKYYKSLKIPSKINIKSLSKDLKDCIKKTNELYLDINYDAILEEFNEISSNQLKSSYQLLNIFNSSKDYLEDNLPSNCPICNSEIKSSEITQDLLIKIDELRDNHNQFEEFKNNINYLITDLKELSSYFKAIEDILDELSLEDNSKNNNLLNSKFVLESTMFIIDDLSKELLDLTKFNTILTSPIKNKFIQIKDSINSLDESISNYSKDLLDDDNIDDLNLISSVLIKLDENNKLYDEFSVLFNYKDYSDTTLNTFKDLKRDFITDILDSLKEDIDKYYKFIHGDDKICSPNFYVPDSKQVNLFINSFDSENNVDLELIQVKDILIH